MSFVQLCVVGLADLYYFQCLICRLLNSLWLTIATTTTTSETGKESLLKILNQVWIINTVWMKSRRLASTAVSLFMIRETAMSSYKVKAKTLLKVFLKLSSQGDRKVGG